MRRTDAAGGEYIGVLVAKCVDCIDDGGFVVLHNTAFAKVDADFTEAAGEVIQVGVGGAAGEDFVTDDQNCCCGIGHGGAFFFV